jgi:hypothetical protein
MPGPQPRLHLPYANWPTADRLLWEHAFGQDDPFAEIRLAKASRDRCMWSWRRFLGFVANNEPEALEIAPAGRLTLGRVKPFVTHLTVNQRAELSRGCRRRTLYGRPCDDARSRLELA